MLEYLAFVASFYLLIKINHAFYEFNNLLDSNAVVYKPKKKVSFVITSLNEEWHIETTLKSLHEQNVVKKHRDFFEFILVDNYSVDSTIEKAYGYVDKIFLTPQSLRECRELGIKESSGDIILLIDCDRVYPPNYVNRMLRWFWFDDDVVAVTTSVIINKTPDIITEYDIKSAVSNALFNSTFKRCLDKILGGACAFLKTAFYEVGGYDLRNLTQDEINNMDFIQSEYNIDYVVFTQEINFLRKMKEIGKVVCDPFLSPIENGYFRRFYMDKYYKELCNESMSSEYEHLCKFWEDRISEKRF